MFLFDWFLGILASLCRWQIEDLQIEAEILFLRILISCRWLCMWQIEAEILVLRILFSLCRWLCRWQIEAEILFLSLYNSGETTVLQKLQDVVFILFYYLFDWFYGILASLGLWQKEAKILFLGLDSSGKTTVLHRLKDERLVQHQRTHYPISEEFSIGKIKFKAFDLGGHQIARRVWKDYYAKVDAVVYVVNVLDRERIAESKRELDALLSDESLANVPFLILGNKIDIPCAASEHELGNVLVRDLFNLFNAHLSEDELQFHLGLTNFTTGKGKVNLGDTNIRPLEIFMCCIVCKKDYEDGFKWLSQYIK